MNRLVKFCVMAVLVVVGVLVAQSAANAHHCTGSTYLTGSGGSASAACHGSYPGAAPSSSSSASALWAAYCAHRTPWTPGSTVNARQITSDPLSVEAAVVAAGIDPSGEYAWFEVSCVTGAGVSFVGWVGLLTLSPPVPPEVLRDRAAARINPPSPAVATSPPLERFAVVNLETWLWVTDRWEPLRETESAGFTRVDVVARPETLTWEFSNGESVVCHGPGIEWSEAVDRGGTYCGHTFTRSSAGEPGDAFTATATIEWIFSWAINGNDQGDFGSVDTVSDFSLQVGEIQVLETNP